MISNNGTGSSPWPFSSSSVSSIPSASALRRSQNHEETTLEAIYQEFQFIGHRRHLRRNDPDGAKREYILNQVLHLDVYEDRIRDGKIAGDDKNNRIVPPKPIYDVSSSQYKAFVWVWWYVRS